GQLTEAMFRLGDLHACGDHARRALAHFGFVVPGETRVGLLVAILREAVVRALQVVLRVRSVDVERASRVVDAVSPVQYRLIETFFYSLEALPLVWGTLRLMNQCEPVGPRPDLARGYVLAGLLAGVVPAPRVAEAWCRRAIAIATATGSRQDVGWIHARTAVFQIGVCRWEEALAGVNLGIASAAEAGDLRMWEEIHLEGGLLHFFTGQLDRAAEWLEHSYESTLRSGNLQSRTGAMILRADVLVRLGRDAEARVLIADTRRLLEHADVRASRSEVASAVSTEALLCLRAGDHRGAYDAVTEAMSVLGASQPVGYWMLPSLSAVAEVLLTLAESASLGPEWHDVLMRQARLAIRIFRGFAKHLPFARAAALSWRGTFAWVRGRRPLAMRCWRRAIDAGAAQRMPYDLARAHLELGRHLDPQSPARIAHLREALATFDRLGCTTESASVRGQLGTSA
ncbi:MAG: hypothetical protein ACREQL_14150, partial [Candidatus Binatia bacterium]